MKSPTTPKGVKKLINPWLNNDVRDMPNGKAVRVRTIIADYLRSHKYDKLNIATKIRYQYCLKVLELFILGNNRSIYEMYVHKVDYSIVDYLHKVFAHTHKPATIKFYFAILSNVWQHALRSGKAFNNPWLRNEVVVKNERDIIWTPEQIDKAVEVAKKQGMHVLALYLVILYETGIRVWSDLRPLTWDNVRVHNDGSTVLDFTISKTGVRLILPLSERAIYILSSLPRSNEHIFSDATGKVLSKQVIWTQLKKVKMAANLPMCLQFRDIRRAVNTELAMSGASREEMRNVNGWKSDRHIPRYAVLRYGTAKNGMEKLWELRKQQSGSIEVCVQPESTKEQP